MERAEFFEKIRSTRNWGRWGDDDTAGTTNLIDESKRLKAVSSVQSGQVVSLAHPHNDWGEGSGAATERQFSHSVFEDEGGGLTERISLSYHGLTMTHIDAFCHLWFEGRMWNDKDPVGPPDNRIGLTTDVEAFGNGIVTRGVLLDIPRLRGVGYVTVDRPVEGSDLEDAAKREDIQIEPGDALVVYSGREAYEREIGPWGRSTASGGGSTSIFAGDRPGLEGSCVPTVRNWDVALLIWDMMDARPNVTGTPFTMHRALGAYGLPLVDNAALEELAEACAERRRWDFLLMVAPLRLVGSTGSPVNPIAVL